MEIIKDISELNRFIYKQPIFAIYGAGMVGKLFVRYCEYKHLKDKIAHVLVSEQNDQIFVREKRIYPITDVSCLEELPILITVKEELQEEIRNALHKCGNIDILAMSDECIDEMSCYCRKKEIENGIAIEAACQALEIRDVHSKTFGEYENMFYGKEVAIIATGPSLNQYVPIENVINIGVNSSYKYKKVGLHYLFFQDYGGIRRELMDDIIGLPCIKFLGKYMENSYVCMDEDRYKTQIPESKAIAANAKRYFIQAPSDGEPHRDIKYYPLLGQGSVVFAALQFALFGNPRRIYLVGCDCSDTGHFDTPQVTGMNTDIIYNGYLKMKRFSQYHYPDTEIVSVNPIGLKGLFKDIYQDNI